MSTDIDDREVAQAVEGTQTISPEKPPSISVRQVIKLKRKLSTDPELCDLIDADLVHKDIENFVDILLPKLPPRISRQVVIDSLTHLCHQRISAEDLPNIFWRLAGNITRLRAGRTAGPWTRQVDFEWMPLQVVNRMPRRGLGGNIGDDFTFRVLAGTATGHLINRFWTRKFSGYLSSHMGYSKPWGKYPYHESAGFTGMRLYGLFDPELSGHGPQFDKVHVSPGLMTHNRNLIKARLRQGFVCPQAFTHPCTHCPIGYDKCPAAVHPRTYVKQTCRKCSLPSWFDPSHVELGLCVDCTTTQAMARE